MCSSTVDYQTFFTKNIYLLSNFMPIPDRIDVHIVGACGIGHQVDFRELGLKGQCNGQSPTNTP